ncbi:MAG: cation transporter [Dehalococcoidia bacterium]
MPGSRRLALALLWLTIGWNVVEGVIAVAAGVAASSVALVGFGLDSFIEVTAAGVLIWRFGLPEHDESAEQRERTAHRVVGMTFLALALYIGVQAVYTVATGEQPEASRPGLVLAAVSLIVMPVLGLAKRTNAKRIGSRALVAESTETLVCSYLSFALLAGLGANAAFGWWWADIVAALAMVPWIIREGLEGVRGESCEDNCE